MIEDKRRLVHPKPCKRKPLQAGRIATEFLEVIAAFIGEETSYMEAARQRFFYPGKELGDLVQRTGGDDADRVQEKIAKSVGRVETKCLQKDGTGGIRDHRVYGFRELSPLRHAFFF
jgi:hypothetical protein